MRTFPERPIFWSQGRLATGPHRRPHLELLSICFSSEKTVIDV